MMMSLNIPSAVFIVLIGFTSTLASATTTNHSEVSEVFTRIIRGYFDGLAGGHPVLDEIEFTGDVEAALAKLRDAAPVPEADRVIEDELAIARIFDAYLCRIGVGAAAGARALLFECVAAPKNEMATDRSLARAFLRARDAELMPSPLRLTRFPNLARLVLIGYAIDALEPRLVPLPIYLNEAPTDLVASAVDRARERLTYLDGTVTEEIISWPRWHIDLGRNGAHLKKELEAELNAHIGRLIRDELTCRDAFE